MKSFYFVGGSPDTKEIKKIHENWFIKSFASISVRHCSAKNKQKMFFFFPFFSQDDDAFSIVIVDDARGWNSSSFKMWKHEIMMKIHPFMDLNELEHDNELQYQATKWKWKRKFVNLKSNLNEKETSNDASVWFIKLFACS